MSTFAHVTLAYFSEIIKLVTVISYDVLNGSSNENARLSVKAIQLFGPKGKNIIAVLEVISIEKMSGVSGQ